MEPLRSGGPVPVPPAPPPPPAAGGVVACSPPAPPEPLPPVEAARVLDRHRVTEVGDPSGPVLLLAHGFGGGQEAWRRLLPHFPRHRVVLFDHLGSGGTSIDDVDHHRHASLTGYAEDLLAVCAALDLQEVTVVGHSVSAAVAVLAAAAEPARFRSLVMVAPSPRYVDDPATGYTGGFSLQDVHELLESLDSNYYAWSAAMAPVVMGAPGAPDLGAELTESFLGTHPDAARTFARAIFLGDVRASLPLVRVPALVLQCRHDALAPEGVGRAVAAALPAGTLVHLSATGHCPHVSAPAETAAAVHRHLDALDAAAARGTGGVVPAARRSAAEGQPLPSAPEPV